MPSPPDVVLVRHGETEWTVARRHTGNTDVPLTEEGRREGKLLGRRLAGEHFTRVLSSPLSRALDTCRLALPDPPAPVEVRGPGRVGC